MRIRKVVYSCIGVVARSRWTMRHRYVDLNGTGGCVQTAIAIDPITADNGPLALIPRSHLRGHLPHTKAKVAAESFDAATAERPLLEPGDVLLFGPYTIHGSEANRSRIARRSFLNGFAFPGATKKIFASAVDGEGQMISV